MFYKHNLHIKNFLEHFQDLKYLFYKKNYVHSLKIKRLETPCSYLGQLVSMLAGITTLPGLKIHPHPSRFW